MARLDVEIVGRGPDLVLLHSLLSDRTSFAPLAARLADRRRLIMVSLPGFDASPPAEPLAGYADAVAETLVEIGVSPGVDVLGNGLGGFVALTLAAQHVGIVGRLVLVGSGVAFPEDGRATFRAMAKTAAEKGMAALAEAAMNRLFPSEFVAANPALVADRRAVFLRIDRQVFINACNALAVLDLGGDLAQITQPTLIVVGEKDGATPPALGRELAARLPHATMIELSGLAHAPHMQDPDAFLAAVSPFLRAR